MYDTLTTIIRDWKARSEAAHVDIAAECGVSVGFVGQWMTGRKRPGSVDLVKLGRMAGVSDQELAAAHGALERAKVERRAKMQAAGRRRHANEDRRTKGAG